MKVKTRNLSWRVGKRKIVERINLEIGSDDMVGLVGPNGSGKSSFLRLIYKYYQPFGGSVFVGRKDVSLLSQKEVARKLAVVPQERGALQGITVYDVVAMGRTPHKGLFDSDTEEDHKIILKALRKVKLLNEVDRSFDTLSGGERQRVLIALALAQETKVLVLDEPTNHLDPLHQLQIMEIIKELKRTTIVAMHDLNLASRYCDKIVLLDEGEIVVVGEPEKVLTKKNIREVYGVNVDIDIDRKSGKLNIVFLGINGK
jgi:iron complex transport system ATP-binding protein